jgi:alkylated DNA repair dioxygenase AlkB
MSAQLRAQDPRVPQRLIPSDQESSEGQVVFTERGLFTRDEASKIADDMNKAKNPVLQPERVKRGGREFVLDRRTAYFGDKDASYSYAGITRPSRAWGEGAMGRVVDRVRGRVEKRTGRHYSYCLVNYYPTGKTGLGFHADDETDLDPDAPIVSVSFGATRDMIFKHTRKELKDIKVALPSGSMVEMHPPLQSKWKHGIPPRKRVSTGRFNLTFRVLRK